MHSCHLACILYTQLSIHTNILITCDTRGSRNKTAIRRGQPLVPILHPPPWPPPALECQRKQRSSLFGVGTPCYRMEKRMILKTMICKAASSTPLPAGPQNHTWIERNSAWHRRNQNVTDTRLLEFVLMDHFEQMRPNYVWHELCSTHTG